MCTRSTSCPRRRTATTSSWCSSGPMGTSRRRSRSAEPARDRRAGTRGALAFRRRGTECRRMPAPAPAAELAAAFAAAVAAFRRHLDSERGLSRHTVAAYVTDVTSLLDHAARLGATTLDEIDATALRSWLARLRTSGYARSTLARRSSAARVF